MDSSPFISVVMPVYNALPWISAAVKSVLGQSFRDIELIFVDDGSSDRSRAACEDTCRHDSRARLLALPENAGLSNARNRGFELCRGTYVMFMDADDEIDPGLFKQCSKALAGTPSDWVVWGVTEVYCTRSGTAAHTRKIETQKQYLDSPGALHAEYIKLEKQTLFGYAWNKLYLAERIRSLGLTFPDIRLIEDVLFNIEFAKGAKSLHIISGAPYRYTKKDAGNLTSGFIAGYFSLNEKRLESLLGMYREWGADNAEIRAVLADIYVRYLYSALVRNCSEESKMNHDGRKQWLRGIFTSALYAELMPYAAPQNPVVRLMASAARRKLMSICLFYGRIIWLARTHLPYIYTYAKQNR